ncbi:MAG: DUF6512 family protein [Dehalococcoidia bacterium]|jgi:hypothetical protein
MSNAILKWELIGIGAISLLGALFHFLFELAGEWPPVGFFAAVNESVFEHLKLTFWPAVIYSAATYKILKNHTENYFTARAVAVYVMPLVILALFYTYTELTGWESLAADIIIFVVAIAAGQLASYKIMTLNRLPRWMNYVSIGLMVSLALVYGLLTFYPPHISMFLDSNAGVYGIP